MKSRPRLPSISGALETLRLQSNELHDHKQGTVPIAYNIRARQKFMAEAKNHGILGKKQRNRYVLMRFRGYDQLTALIGSE